MRKTIAMLLAGGQGSRLGILSSKRAKPAVPFAGAYRIIDFTLSNCMNSYVSHIGILTQYKPVSLIEHIGSGHSWGYVGRRRSITVLPPYTAENDSDWYKGTADAILQNLSYIRNFDSERVIVLSGDHIYKMDYRAMIDFHKKMNADLTIAAMEVPKKEANRYGILEIDKENRILDFAEKPDKPKNNLASLGIYVFNTRILTKRLIEDAAMSTSHDFGKDIIKRMISIDNVYAYNFNGYWRDVGTLQSFWETNMELLKPSSAFDIYNWRTRTNPNDRYLGDRLPSYVASSAEVENSVISVGSVIHGRVINSVLSPGVKVCAGAVVRDSVIMHDVVVNAGAFVDKTIIDKDVVIGENTKIGVGKPSINKMYPNILSEDITVIGKQAQISKDLSIGKSCIIFPDVVPSDFVSKNIESGETVFHLGDE